MPLHPIAIIATPIHSEVHRMRLQVLNLRYRKSRSKFLQPPKNLLPIFLIFTVLMRSVPTASASSILYHEHNYGQQSNEGRAVYTTAPTGTKSVILPRHNETSSKPTKVVSTEVVSTEVDGLGKEHLEASIEHKLPAGLTNDEPGPVLYQCVRKKNCEGEDCQYICDLIERGEAPDNDEIIDISKLVIKDQESFIVKVTVSSAAAMSSPHSSLLVINNNPDGAEKAQKFASLAVACVGLWVLSINLFSMLYRFLERRRNHQQGTDLEREAGMRPIYYQLFLDENFRKHLDELNEGNAEALLHEQLRLWQATTGQRSLDRGSRSSGAQDERIRPAIEPSRKSREDWIPNLTGFLQFVTQFLGSWTGTS
ncbi:hypothetical protein DFH27DRAFT_564517 [Peziza echinospora]|nr:hypothetical protein DFH27DRAFT_564517 [Peziza echinospora]